MRATDAFEPGDRVKVASNGPSGALDLVGMQGTVIGRDAYTVEVRMDQVTKEMEGFSDARTGVLNFEPEQLTICQK